ncbi:aldolase/citrate lyase family protein [Frigoribacterium sp. RIT-PI-h]|uniref:aldolase/citrate lyase family protein n=1 Tax=Frigoribacterium sp. RIT-PI-h TaxID=1690245 RepID=UPI000B0544E0|nr:aldolase/citrate lyase family protein [Frigoribacterium sp. RIT-PI-h]
MSTASDFARTIRRRERAVGYWITLDAPPATERSARLGYDYVCLDAQHGLFGYQGMMTGLLAIDAGQTSAGLVRVEANDITPIGKALDAGAAGIIVPLVDTAEDAAPAGRARSTRRTAAARTDPCGRACASAPCRPPRTTRRSCPR